MLDTPPKKLKSAHRHTLREEVELPRIDRWLMRGFDQFFLPRYLRKHFHALAVNRESLHDSLLAQDAAVVVYANHASWWDPMVAMFALRRVMSRERLYAPIDASALARYRIFNRMGFYGIDPRSRRGASEFLRRSLRIAREPGAMLALTPEARFCDCRDVQQRLVPGLAHLAFAIERVARPHDPRLSGAQQSSCVWFVPVALEYPFWEERLPECLCWFGDPVCVQWGHSTRDKWGWDNELTSRLRAAQQALSVASIARDDARFELLLSGSSGTWRFYDWARRIAASLRRKPLTLEHGQKLSNRRRS